MHHNKKIKVLQAIRQGKTGGGESHILELVGTMDRSRFETAVLSFTDGPMIDALQEMKVPAHVIPSEKAFDVKLWKKVKDFLRKEAFDVVHIHGTRACTNVLWAARSLGVPVVYTVHGWSFHEGLPSIKKRARIAAEKYITGRTQANICVSESNRQTGLDAFGKFRSVVIRNGVNIDKFNPGAHYPNVRGAYGIAADAVVVGWVARMTYQKDPLGMLRAFSMALTGNPKLHLLMIGDGELKGEALQLAETLGISHAVTFDGFRQDVPAVLNAIDIYCLPSRWEGFPIGVLEAMAMGKAIVASDVDGTREAVEHGVSGILTPADNPAAVAHAIGQLVNNEEDMRRMREAARSAVAAKHAVGEMTRRIQEVYEQLYDMTLSAKTISFEYERAADVKRLQFIVRQLQDAIPPGGEILDVGCGNGVISRHLGQYGYRVLGIDISEKTIANARAKNTQPNVRFEAISAEDLTAQGHRYDAVICSEVLEHLHEPRVLLETIYQSLKDDGRLIVTVPNGAGPRELFVTRPMLRIRNNPTLWKMVNGVKKALGFRGTTVQSAADNLDHVQFFTRGALRQLAASNRFRIVGFGKTNFIEDVFPFSILTKRIKALQRLDCQVAELLPVSFTGGFNTIWKKDQNVSHS